jgi:hypothetical protein
MSNFKGQLGGQSKQLNLVSVLSWIWVESIMRFKITHRTVVYPV